jgi:hypothetical protein
MVISLVQLGKGCRRQRLAAKGKIAQGFEDKLISQLLADEQNEICR